MEGVSRWGVIVVRPRLYREVRCVCAEAQCAAAAVPSPQAKGEMVYPRWAV